MTERILWIVAVLVVGAGGFFGGQQVGRQAGMQARSQAQQQFFAQRGGGQVPGGPAMNGTPGALPGGAPVIGTVARVEGDKVVLSTTDGNEVTVTLAEGASVRRQVEGQLSDLMVGEQVMAFGTRDGNNLQANSVQIGSGGFGRGNGNAAPAP